MVRFDNTKTNIKKTVAPGTVIYLQGEKDKVFYILHSGLVEILYYPEWNENSPPKEILSGSLRVGLVKGESLIEILGLLEQDVPYSVSVRTISDCIITSSPTSTEEFIPRMQKDLPLNFRALRNLSARIESSFYLIRNYKYLWHKYASIADSIALGYPVAPSAGPEKVSRSESALEEYAAYLRKINREDESIEEACSWDPNLFLGKIQDKLELYSDMDNLQIENVIDNKQYLFIKRLIQKEDQILTGIFKNDEPANRYLFNFFSGTISTLLDFHKNIAQQIHFLMNKLYGKNGWVEKILAEADLEKPAIKKYFHFLTRFSLRCHKDTMMLLGKDLIKEYPVFSKLKPFRDYPWEEEKEENNQEVRNDLDAAKLKKYENLLQKILMFSDLPEDFTKRFSAVMDDFVSLENKLESTEELKKLRKELSRGYWQIYEACFLKVIDSDLKGFIPGIMLHFGVIDERLLNREDLARLDNFYTGELYSDDTIPVMTFPYFLDQIYKSRLSPSLTEMGDTFKQVLARQEKMTKREKEAACLFENTPEDRVRFEIRNIAADLSKVLYGNKIRALPFLFSESIQGNVSQAFVNIQGFNNTIEKIRKRDFSLFYREILFKHPAGSEFIQKEVLPSFVFYPLPGSRIIMWQEMEGTRKNTPGRFFLPLFFSGKLEEQVLTQLAYFRWELNKTVAGYNWTDPVEGGLVGMYYDYIQFYKKNPNLTPEAKERLTEFIKNTKSDKDRFAQEYMLWVLYEYEGNMRLNSYAREIFYRFCPFPENIRADMALKPLYAPLENRLRNKRQAEIVKLKSKINKFQKTNTSIPREIMAYMEYLER